MIRKQKLTPKDKGFYEAVTKLFDDVIYKTQVVDSVLTKNEFLRSKGLFARLTGSFMSEPTTTASMLIDAFDKYQMDMQRGLTKQQAWKKNRDMIVRTAYVYGLGAVILAAVQAVADAFRDDDDYEKFYEKWLQAFGGNLVDEIMPFNKLPIVSDFYELAKELLSIMGVDTYGNPPQSVYMQWYDSLVKGVEILHDKISGEKTNYTWYGGTYKLLQAASGLTGLPMAAATREIVTAWNNTIGAMAPSLKVQSYKTTEAQTADALLEALIEGNQKESGEISAKFANESEKTSALRSAIKRLYASGDIDQKTARSYLTTYTGMKIDETYWTLKSWDYAQENGSSDGYSKYGDLYKAVESGENLDAVIKEYTDNGEKKFEIAEKVRSYEEEIAIKNRFGMTYNDAREAYASGEISRDTMYDVLVYSGKTETEAEDTLTEWDIENRLGIDYGKLDDAYKYGDITREELYDAIVENGETPEDAEEAVQCYDWLKERVYEYPDLGISDARKFVIKISDKCEESKENTLADYGVDVDTYLDYSERRTYCSGVDADGDGKTDSGTLRDSIFAMIDSMPINSSQKDALAMLSYGMKSIKKNAPWH